jgi:MFS family permease
MSGLLTGRAFTEEFPEIDTTPTGTGSASLQGTVVAIYEIGCLAGSLFAFFFGDRFGRRKMIMMGCTILIIGAALQTSASGIPHMIVSSARSSGKERFLTLATRSVELLPVLETA